MALTFTDIGEFEIYSPDPRPTGCEDYPDNAVFLRRKADGADWYTLSREAGNWYVDSLIATCLPASAGYLFQAIVRNPTDAFPVGCRVLEILGHDPADPKPWAAYEGRLFDFATMTVGAVPKPPVRDVAATQAKIQLFRTKTPDGSNLLAKTRTLVSQSGDEELDLWFNGAARWYVADPNVQKIGGAFGLQPADIQGLFDAADLISA